MNTQQQADLFRGRTWGEILRDLGLDRLEDSAAEWLSIVRAVAVQICKDRGSVSSDDLRVWANENDCQPHHPNAWGGVFRGKQWTPVAFKQSKTPSRHASLQRVWALCEETGVIDNDR